MIKKSLIALLLGIVWTISSPLFAQQVLSSAPSGRFSEHWYENLGTSFYLEQNFSRGGWFFNWGAPVFPPFGGYDGRDARFGVAVRQGNFRGRLNFWANQGVHRSMMMESPYITMPNGGYGAIQSGTWRPFVMGWAPVLGNQPQWHYPLRNFVRSAEGQSLTATSGGDNDAQPIEYVSPTLNAPKQDPPLTLINGEESSGSAR